MKQSPCKAECSELQKEDLIKSVRSEEEMQSTCLNLIGDTWDATVEMACLWLWHCQNSLVLRREKWCFKTSGQSGHVTMCVRAPAEDETRCHDCIKCETED